MAGWDDVLSTLTRIEAYLPEIAKVAVVAGIAPVFDESQDRVPKVTHKLERSGKIIPAEFNGGEATSGISYGDESTRTGWGGAQSAGFGPGRENQGALWEDIGYEVLVHEGHRIVVFGRDTGRMQPPNKFLEIPLMNQENDIGPRMAEAVHDGIEVAAK